MKIALLQFDPDVGTVQANIKRADDLLQRSKIPVDLDWLILPEMAFSDNSTVTISPIGQILQNYRKSFLYYTDETWAAEPPARFQIEHLNKLGPIIQGICMDINPHRFLAPWSDYEFATAALASVPPRPMITPGEAAPPRETPLIVVSMAWLSYLTASEIASDPTSPDVATVAYWVERFQPIVERSKEVPGPWYVVLANRCGREKSVCYAGSSTVIKVEDGGVSLFETCGRGEERVLCVDLEGEPRFSVRSGR
ncbi:uncharacterized protein N0V89_005554 [Didymosphaeria variabile]|uniref:Carbon-nitrogen hydrolase n=1 Tax=Didymosphaeria variabile TaxID=1932322 RepID=A0A9W8XLN6_9PLEO|nr:uncharacterized protein N0V89_005554 [Didymosphaeria variabile]KAJ4353824.1 hypothetical protein N0V89_005554 [Didymosphaeria variabile]